MSHLWLHHSVAAPDVVPRTSPWRCVRIALAVLVVGIVLTGQGIFLVTAIRSGVSPGGSAVSVPHGVGLRRQVSALVAIVLGPSDRGVRRFRVVSVHPDRSAPRLRDVVIVWALNNDISDGSIGNGGQVDVYLVLRALYSEHLPIAVIRLTGTYPVYNAGEVPVMRVSMNRKVAESISRTGWSSLDAQAVWPLVRRPFVAPQFVPISSG